MAELKSNELNGVVGGASSGIVEYTVRNGDTLESIAAKFGTDVKSIMANNGITDPSVLFVGQVLVIA